MRRDQKWGGPQPREASVLSQEVANINVSHATGGPCKMRPRFHVAMWISLVTLTRAELVDYQG